MCSGQETVEEVYKILRTNYDADWYLVAAQDGGYIGRTQPVGARVPCGTPIH